MAEKKEDVTFLLSQVIYEQSKNNSLINARCRSLEREIKMLKDELTDVSAENQTHKKTIRQFETHFFTMDSKQDHE